MRPRARRILVGIGNISPQGHLRECLYGFHRHSPDPPKSQISPKGYPRAHENICSFPDAQTPCARRTGNDKSSSRALTQTKSSTYGAVTSKLLLGEGQRGRARLAGLSAEVWHSLSRLHFGDKPKPRRWHNKALLAFPVPWPTEGRAQPARLRKKQPGIDSWRCFWTSCYCLFA